ncbi:MAG: uncharacterized protein KVP18_000783 [Porospora cf. gigantea A]|nr:MAG: hypothetical protein KVP18_000783 [Porospora cf. gigantea A]
MADLSVSIYFLQSSYPASSVVGQLFDIMPRSSFSIDLIPVTIVILSLLMPSFVGVAVVWARIPFLCGFHQVRPGKTSVSMMLDLAFLSLWCASGTVVFIADHAGLISTWRSGTNTNDTSSTVQCCVLLSSTVLAFMLFLWKPYPSYLYLRMDDADDFKWLAGITETLLNPKTSMSQYPFGGSKGMRAKVGALENQMFTGAKDAAKEAIGVPGVG